MFLVVFLLPLFVEANVFWMTAELSRVDWREGCLTTAGCSQPRFKIVQDMIPLKERQAISWPVTEHFAQGEHHSMNTHWTVGRPEDLSLNAQVVGTDPTYGFPRVCDQTAGVRLFQQAVLSAFDRLRSRRHQLTTPSPDEEQGKTIIEVRGKCFNATLVVQKHTDRCPWCPDPADVTLIGQELTEEEAPMRSFLRLSDDHVLHMGLVALAVVAAASSAAFGCVLVMFLKQKKSARQISVKPRYHPYSPALVKITDDESRYDLPWETHPSRGLGYWTKSETATTTSPIDSSSSLGTKYNFRPPQVPQTRIYHHISPNSSAHDSGLESV